MNMLSDANHVVFTDRLYADLRCARSPIPGRLRGASEARVIAGYVQSGREVADAVMCA